MNNNQKLTVKEQISNIVFKVWHCPLYLSECFLMCYADNTDSYVLQELLFGIDFMYKM